MTEAVTRTQILAKAQETLDAVNALQLANEAALDRIEGKLDDHGVRLAALLDGQAHLEQGQTAIAVTVDQVKTDVEQILTALQGDDEPPPPPPPPTKTLWGFNVGGWGDTKGESQTAAVARIVETFGPLQVVRWWINAFFDWKQLPSYFGDAAVAPNLGNDLDGVLAGRYDDTWARTCEQATRPALTTGLHEPEDNGYELAKWQAAQMRLAAIQARVGNPLVKFGPLLMGASYHATRYKNTTGDGKGRPASEWLDFDLTNCDFVGADCYQWGKGDADADHAETVIGPVRDMAIAKGKKVLIGELGARRRQTVSDFTRARFITETADIVAANPGLFLAICYYETDRGAADKIPWNLLPPPGGDPADPQYSPAAVAAYRALCKA